MTKIADAVGYVLPHRYVLKVTYPTGMVNYEYFPSELRMRMRQAELMGETSDPFGHDKLLSPHQDKKKMSPNEDMDREQYRKSLGLVRGV